MRTIWTVVSVLAIANLLALGGVAAWLLGSDRLDRERLGRLREMVAEPVREERTRLERVAADAQAAARQAEIARREAEAPLSAAEQLHVRLDLSEVDHQRLERLRRETRDLTVAVERDQQRLAAERRTFEAEREAFEQMRSRLAEMEGSAQFRKAVGTLQGLRPADAVAILIEILGRSGGGVVRSGADGGEGIPVLHGGPDQVVAYLNAMQERTRNRIMGEIASADPALAADLLERLRTRGLIARALEPAPR